MSATAPTQITTGQIAERVERWTRFMKPDADPGFMFIIRCDDPPSDLPTAPPHWPDRISERIEYKWIAYQHALQHAARIDDDWVPHVNMMTGTEVFAEAFGCDVHRPDNTNPFALPLIHSAAEVSQLRVPELSTSTLAYHFDMADELQRRAGPDAVFRPVDIQSPMDIAALIWEKCSFYIAMFEAPDAVRELADKVAQLLETFLEEWFRRYGQSFVAHYPDYFMPRGMTLSEDEIGAVNENIFIDLFLPELNRLSDRFGGIGIHCCADAGHQWKHLKKVSGLRLLNLCRPPTRQPEEYVKPAYPVFRDTCVQQHHGWNPDGPVETWPEKFPVGCRVVFETTVETIDEAQRLAAALQETRGRLYG